MIPNIFDSDPRASRLINFAADLVGDLRPDLQIDDDALKADIMRRWKLEAGGKILAGEPLAGVIRDMIQHAWCYGDAVILHSNTDGYSAQYLDAASPMYNIDPAGNLTAAGLVNVAVSSIQYSLLRFRRKDKYRGKPAVTCIYSHLRDLDHITNNYKEAIKTSSQASLILKTEAPLTTPVEDLKIFDDPLDPNASTAKARDASTAGGAIVLRQGENLDILSDSRPRPEAASFMDSLKAEIAFGFGLPAELVYDCTSLKGGQTRLRTSEAINWVTQHREAVSEILNQIWGRWIIDRYIKPLGIQDAAIIAKLVRPQWRARSPIVVDQRYDSQTTIAMIDAGIMSRTEVVAANGGNWSDTADALARENARLRELGLLGNYHNEDKKDETN